MSSDPLKEAPLISVPMSSVAKISLVPLFERTLAEISSADLLDIKILEEGWFVEFKERAPESAKIAKSIASFANGYGGIFLIGVKESDKTRKFGSFSLLSAGDADAVITRVRESAAAHLHPCPFFDVRKIELPIEEHNGDRCWLIFVKIPKSDRGPHLHSNGVIYTRKGDSSAPIALTDLGLLDRLWSDQKRVKELRRQRIEYLGGQTDPKMPRIEVIVAVEGKPGAELPPFPSFEQFEEVAFNKSSVRIFDSAQPLDGSYVARRTEGNPTVAATRWECDPRNGTHHITIPLAACIWDGQKFNSDAQRVPHKIKKYLPSHQAFIVDLAPALFFIGAVFGMAEKLHASERQFVDIKFNGRACGVKGALIYIDLPAYHEHIKSSHIPLAFREPSYLHPLEDIDAWRELRYNDSAEPNTDLDLLNTLIFFIEVARSLGIASRILLRDGMAGDEHFEALAKLFFDLASTSFSFTATSNPNL